MDDICPSGDLILEVGLAEQKRLLRVSSHILCLASPVFKAMLNSEFLEGSPILASGDKHVFLPEDDFDIVRIFCSIIHFKGRQVIRSPSFELFEDMSIFCDKYDATDALMLWSTVHFESYLSKSVCVTYPACLFDSVERDLHHERSVRLFCAAYAFKNHKSFAHVSRDILHLWNSTTRTRIEHYEQESVPLPSGVLGTPFPLELGWIIIRL